MSATILEQTHVEHRGLAVQFPEDEGGERGDRQHDDTEAMAAEAHPHFGASISPYTKRPRPAIDGARRRIELGRVTVLAGRNDSGSEYEGDESPRLAR